MEVATITARGQTTIPKRIREGAGLLKGDVVAFEIEGDHLIVRKVARGRDEYLQGLSATVSEWASPEDEDARAPLVPRSRRFPRSYAARSHADSFRWRGDFIRTFLERDVPQLGIAVPSAVLDRFWEP